MKHLMMGLAMLLIMVGCNTQRKTGTADVTKPTIPTIEERNLDTLTITAPLWGDDDDYDLTDTEEDYTLPRYNPSATRQHDLLHTRLDLRFDWEKEQVLGKATLRLKPYFYPSNAVTLDAKGFEFQKVTFAGRNEPLSYEYDDQQITIQLGKTFTRKDEYTLYIEYVANPSASGGSAAILSDKGLYFINPRGEEPDKPRQIWTQGETESNSRWFPTIDKPNERCTQEMYLTIEDKYVTLSNGLLVSSKKNADGTRTDYWKMDQPHAPYLFMIAIGEYAVVKDKWRDIPLEYYVEPTYKDHAKAIFAHTPEMLEFFSTKLGVKYPWPKYAQVVVRDYVSGAMENTSAVIFGEFVQKTTRELIDDNNDRIVAHEMFHHWFGDYVTCESWANLTMNEGFANYSEYLWEEYKRGVDAADYHMINDWNGYFSSAQGNMHPLIHFEYEDKEDMFDAHSYNKGGAVLHMLRNYVGDDAFWAALNKYLTDNAYKSVEAHNLRLAFEEVTGEDLNWFFNQWFFSQGHPVLNIEYSYDEDNRLANIVVAQTQTVEGGTPGIFQLPATIDIYSATGDVTRHKVKVNERSQTFSFDVPQRPALINFDGDRMLLCQREENKTEAEYIFQYNHGRKLLDRYEALQNLAYSDNPVALSVFKTALQDKFWLIRAAAIGFIEDNTDETAMAALRRMAQSDPHSQVRVAAFEKLTELSDESSLTVAQQAIEKDSAYPVIGAALQLIVAIAPEQGEAYARKLEQEETNSATLTAIAAIYARTGSPEGLAFFEKNFNRVDGYDAINFIDSYRTIAAAANLEVTMSAMDQLEKMATNLTQSLWRRFASTRAINEMRNELRERFEASGNAEEQTALQGALEKLSEKISRIKQTETNSQLLGLYAQMIED